MIALSIWKDMNKFQINYKFIFADNKCEDYQVELDEKNLQLKQHSIKRLPDWTRLEYNQCDHCPLDSKVVSICPVAANLEPLVELCGNMSSYDKLDVEIETSERTYLVTNTTNQRAFSSLLGLVIATSPCPHTTFFRSMARFHLPLANEQETLYRATSSYLLMQYFIKKSGNKADFDLQGLNKIYKNMQVINANMATRLRTASSNDAAVNAIILLDLFAKDIPYCIDDALDELHYLFSSNIDNFNN
jgi:hypothetical protein